MDSWYKQFFCSQVKSHSTFTFQAHNMQRSPTTSQKHSSTQTCHFKPQLVYAHAYLKARKILVLYQQTSKLHCLNISLLIELNL